MLTLFNPVGKEAPLVKRLNNLNTLQAGTTKLSDFPKIYLTTFSSHREVYVNIDVTVATKF